MQLMQPCKPYTPTCYDSTIPSTLIATNHNQIPRFLPNFFLNFWKDLVWKIQIDSKIIYIYTYCISEVQLAQLLSNKCYDFTPLTPKKDDSSGQPKCKGSWDWDKPRFWRTTSSNSRAYLRVKDKRGPRKRLNTERSAMRPCLSLSLCLSQLLFPLGRQQIIGDHIGDWIRHYDSQSNIANKKTYCKTCF